VAYELVERRVEVGNLEIGMFVCRLDRPWDGTPYPLQGIEITSPEDIKGLARWCEFVYVDAQRQLVADTRLQSLRKRIQSGNRFQRAVVYSDTATFEEEAPRAREAFDNATQSIEKIMQDIAENGVISPEDVDRAVRPLVESILRSSDAFFWIDALRQRDSYTYNHAIGCSALAASFGRHMGFAEETIVSMAAGGLLLDVGKSQLPLELLARQGPLEYDEMMVVRTHVAEGMDILDQSGMLDSEVRDMVRTHHERFDGSGYPDGLAGTAIPLAGRMAAIVDAYHAMCSSRPHAVALSRHQALRRIYGARESEFQGELVEQFQACLGVYPTGSLVELNSGEVAIVMVQNQSRRLQPKVVILTDRDKSPTADFIVVDLITESGEGRREVIRTLPVGAYGIDPADYFLS
jgi:HD-GYP domain-containing protein (c-di-GMP phosphodiesterase class II)